MIPRYLLIKSNFFGLSNYTYIQCTLLNIESTPGINVMCGRTGLVVTGYPWLLSDVMDPRQRLGNLGVDGGVETAIHVPPGGKPCHHVLGPVQTDQGAPTVTLQVDKPMG